MALLSYISFFTVVSYVYLAVYVLTHNRHVSINRACMGFLTCLALWSLQGVWFLHPETSAATAQIWMNIGSLGWIPMGYAFLWFALLYTGTISPAGARWYHGLSLVWVALLVVMQWRGRIVGNIIPTSYGWNYSYVDSFWVAAYLIYAVGAFGLALYLFYRFVVTRSRRVERWQGITLFVFSAISVILAWILNIALPLLEITVVPPVGNITALIWAGWMIVTIIKYKSLTITPVSAAENILATMGDMLFLCDQKGVIVRVNQASCDRIGSRSDKIEGHRIPRFFAAYNVSSVDPTTDAFGQQRIENNRMWLHTAAQERVPVILSSSPLKDKFDDLAGMVIVARDITAILEVEKALQQSELRYRELVEKINDVIYAVDTAGLITYLSPRIGELTGHRPGELIGGQIADIVHDKDLASWNARRKKVLSGHSTAAEVRLVKKDGGIIWVQASGRPIMEAGRVVGIQGILTDSSELVRARKEKHQMEIRLHKAQKMEAIGTLAGGVAHDLNNILSGIVSYPDLLLMDLPETSPLRQPLEVIKSSGLKAATIVQDMLTLARRGVVNMEVVDLNDVVEEYLASPEHHKQRICFPAATVEHRLAADLPAVKGSRVHLAKTLMNLLSNALEALPAGKGRVTVTTATRHLDRPLNGNGNRNWGDYVTLEVADTGTGIAKEDLDRIFEPFYTKKVMGRSGTGLGMAVVWGTVKDHKGHIRVKSEMGKGSLFTLYFPATCEMPLEVCDTTQLSSLMGRGETILVIDDVAEQRLIATSMLAKLDYRLLTAESGYQALEVVQSHKVDLLLLDMIMDPGWDGLETYERILAIRPGLKAIIASGFSETERVRQARHRGASLYIKKPYTLEGIGKAVQKVLGSPTQ